MKEIKVQTAGGMYLVGEHLRFCPSSAGLKELGVTGPGTLKVEFAPDPEWPEEPDDEAWRLGWKGSMKDLFANLEYHVSRRRCGLAAAGWWMEKNAWRVDYDGQYTHAHAVARQWLKWSKGEKWK